MRHVVLITSEMAGRINIVCELARRLEAAGHRATVAATADIGATVRDQGVSFRRLPGASEPSNPGEPGGEQLAGFPQRTLRLLRRLAELRDVAQRRRDAVAALDAAGVAAALAGLTPDLVLCDIELPVPVMAAHARGIPVAAWTSMLSLWKRPNVPPLGSSIVPGTGFRGSRLGIEGEWLRFRAWKWQRRQRQRIAKAGADRMTALQGAARDTGFPLRREADRYEWLIPFTYRTIPTLSCNVLELDFPHRPPPHVRHVGPVLSSSERRPLPAEDAARLEALVERRRAGSQRLVYCSFGAWHAGDDRDFIRRVVAAAAARPHLDLVVGLGGRVDPEQLGATPENVHLFAWAPQREVLRHADAAVHHGGISSVNECIAAGVPMVVYPFDFLDQPGNAARVVYHGLGERGDRGAEGPAEIGGRLDRVMASADIPRRLARMRELLDTAASSNRAVAAVEELLQHPPAE